MFQPFNYASDPLRSQSNGRKGGNFLGAHALPEVEPENRAVALLLLSCVGLGMCTSNLWSVTQTLAGPATSGKWTGVQNFTGNLAGWITPALIGLIVQRTGNFFWVFVITSIVTVLGAAAWIFVVGPIRPVAWPRST